jgi:sulfoxide reductase heme-binding subunit YedZ
MRITDGGRRTADRGRRTADDGEPIIVHLSSVVRRLPSAVVCLCLAPAIVFAARAAAGALTVNPIQEAVQISGRTALNLLFVSLAIGPAVRLLRAPWLLPARRTTGLFAFGWAALHLAIYALVDYGGNLAYIAGEMLAKNYLLAGAAALIVLMPLAVTSTREWQRRLGRRWKTLHRGVFVAAVLALLHYWWALKPDLNDALLIYAPLLCALLLLRIIPGLRRRTSAALPPRAQQQADERA